MSGGEGAPGAKLPRLEAPERGDQPSTTTTTKLGAHAPPVAPATPAPVAVATPAAAAAKMMVAPAAVAVATPAAAAAAGETQRALEAVDACQRELEALNERAGEEILRVERKYGELRRPHFERRNRLIEDIPGFWVTAVSFPPLSPPPPTLQHSLATYVGKPVSQSTPIKWKKGMDLTALSKGLDEKGRKRGHRSFFAWFTEHRNPTTDEIAEVLKDDMWPNPLQYFLIAESESGENGLDDSDEENGDDSVVIVDEDEDEDNEDEDDDVQEIVDEDDDDEDDGSDDEGDDDVQEIDDGEEVEEEGVEVEEEEEDEDGGPTEGGDG
ncbi:protein SET-like [Chiloscyllium punctatum]